MKPPRIKTGPVDIKLAPGEVPVVAEDGFAGLVGGAKPASFIERGASEDIDREMTR